MKTRYVWLTAAKDEEAFIGEVIEYVTRQTVLPLAWFIMDDGSTDQTAQIVRRYAARYSFIHLQSSDSRDGRNFGSQYRAIMAAYDLARTLDFDYVGIVDADQAPERQNYYESILNEFDRDPQLGVASGYIYERPHGTWECRACNSRDSVAASAVFRRCCFDQIGGYTPLSLGGSDWLIQLRAKMLGWGILTRPDLPILHYRPTSSAGGIWRGRFRAGMMDASFGSHPVFEFFKCCRRVPGHPFFLGSVVSFCGYLWWHLAGRKPLIAPEAVDALREGQLSKLNKWVRSFGAAWSGGEHGLEQNRNRVN